MDNLLEILVPLIFAAIYFFGNMLGKSKEEDDASPGAPRRRVADEPDSDAAERQRRIQEEIRRKIMERRQATQGDQPRVAPSGHELRERRQEVEARREAREVRKEAREVVRQSPQEPPPFAAPTHQAESRPPAFSWDESDNAYDQQMQAQLKQIEATKRRAEKLKKEAADRRKTVEPQTKTKRRSGAHFSGSVRESLRDPQAARAAFIYGEVLGRPASLRKEHSAPGLN